MSTQEPSCSTTPRGTEATTVQVRTHHYKTPFLRNTIPKERSIVKVSTQEPSWSTTPRGTEATTVQDTASKRLKWTKEDSTTEKKYFQNYICGTRIGYPGKKDILGFLGKHNLPYTWKSIKIKVMNDKRLHAAKSHLKGRREKCWKCDRKRSDVCLRMCDDRLCQECDDTNRAVFVVVVLRFERCSVSSFKFTYTERVCRRLSTFVDR